MRSLTPQPKRWPRCSRCKTAFVHRLGMVMDKTKSKISAQWIWQRDCKHRNDAAEVAPTSEKTRC